MGACDFVLLQSFPDLLAFRGDVGEDVDLFLDFSEDHAAHSAQGVETGTRGENRHCYTATLGA